MLKLDFSLFLGYFRFWDLALLLFVLRLFIIEDAEFLFLLVIEDSSRIYLEAVLQSLRFYSAVFFCSQSGFFYDEIGD